MRLPAGFLLAPLALSGCFPTQPAEGALKNLRVVAMRQEPAVAMLDRFPLDPVTLRALVVDPLDEELTEAAHVWSLDLPEDFEGAEALEGLVPDGPHETSVDLDFSGLLSMGGEAGAREELDSETFLPTEYGAGLLPMTFVTENESRTREAVKFVRFLFPDLTSMPPPATGPVGWRPVDVYNEALAALPVVPEGWNANPVISKLTVDTDRLVFEEPVGPGGVLDLGSVEPGAGVRIDVEVLDDKDLTETDVDLYWTHGTPGLPVDPEDPDAGGGGGFGGGGAPDAGPVEPAEGEPEAQDGQGFGGGSGGLDEAFQPDRAFGWTAPGLVRQGPMRLFVVVRDAEGGATWQELRLTLAD